MKIIKRYELMDVMFDNESEFNIEWPQLIEAGWKYFSKQTNLWFTLKRDLR